MKTRVIAIFAALAGLIAPLSISTPAEAVGCAKPGFITSSATAMETFGPYIVANNIWNGSGYKISQRLTACSGSDWSVKVTADNNKGDGAVKTYPNVHHDYINWSNNKEPSVPGFKTVRSSWTAHTPSSGIYNAAYDLWLDHFKREIMIWTHNRGQTPAGRKVASILALSGQRWDLWASSDNTYLAFVPHRTLSHGTLDLRSFLAYGQKAKRIPSSSKLSQIGFGFEVVSTGGKAATFSVTRFSIGTAR